MNAFLLLVLLAEMALLFRIEQKMWRTLYTPLNFLMLPYAAVLGITLILSGRLGLAEFYYPSLIPWIIGLPLFAVPGWLSFLYERRSSDSKTAGLKPERDSKNPLFKIVLASLIVITLGLRLIVLLLQDGGTIGNEHFGQIFAGRGWSGHLLLVGASLSMLLLFDKPKWYSWLLSAFLLFFLFVYQVKSWIILPLLAVFFALLISGRIKLKTRYLLGVGIGVSLIFFAKYLQMFFAGNRSFFAESPTFATQLKSISGLFVHYITSGTFGLSLDMQQGVLEEPNLQNIFTPFYNLWYIITGQPTISGRNMEFLQSGIALTNVRSFFGTLYVFTRPAGFAVCCLFFGTVCQCVFWFFRKCKTTCTVLLFAWTCTVLFMGWFDFMPYLSNVFEIPFWILIIGLMQHFLTLPHTNIDKENSKP